MLELRSGAKDVHLKAGTTVQVVLNSPLFDEALIKGEYSYSFDVPAGPNGPLFGYPERPDALLSAEPLPATLREQELDLLTGTQTVTKASPARYTVSLQGGLAGARLSERLLSSFDYGGVRLYPRVVPDAQGQPYPGLLAHMSEVVATPGDYDYVFAPLRNEYLPEPLPYAADPLDLPPATTNPWGSGVFLNVYAAPFLVMGLPPVYQPPRLGGYCPFPRLRYVLRAILEEAGLVVDEAHLLPGELGDLVIVTNAQLVDRGDVGHGGFHLADVLPALTVAELFAALRADLGVVVYVDRATGRARTGNLAECVALAAQDLSHLLAGYPETSPGKTDGLTLTYRVDGEDELTKDLLDQQPAPERVLPAVATVADLPTTALLADKPAAGQVRVVEERDIYYQCSLSYRDPLTVGLSWTALTESLPALPVAGGGPEQAQHTCYTAFTPTRLRATPGAGADYACPAISQAPFRADVATDTRSSALRLLFYNGLQTGANGDPYPQLARQNAAGTRSLRLGGSTGTYATGLAAWLPVKLRGTVYTQALALSPLDLARLDLARPVVLDGVAYLVRKLTCTVPLRKPGTAELTRLW